MVNYYRDTWRPRAHILAPLTELTKKEVKFAWTPELQQCFDQVKQHIAQQTTLTFPDYTQPFEIYTDASTRQLGGVIMQNKKPLAYFSRKLSPAQQKYSVIDLELLSIVEILKEYRYILLGYPITIYSDHKNLQEANYSNPRTTRWRLLIEQFGPTIQYLPGKQNILADGLSRLNTSSAETALPMLQIYEERYPLEVSNIAKAQQNARIKGQIQKEINGFIIQLSSMKQMLIPPSLRKATLHWYHIHLFHPGRQRQYASMKSICYWKRMHQDVAKYVANCTICKMQKRRDFRKNIAQIPQQCSEEPRPWRAVAVDILVLDKQMILTMIDPDTRWPELIAIPDRKGITVTTAFETEWLNRYPRPVQIIHDQGTEFMDKHFQDVLSRYGIKEQISSTANPQSNSVVERMHQTIEMMLRSKTKLKLPIETILQDVAYALRATINTSTNASPAQLVFQRDMLQDVEYQTNWKALHERRIHQMQQANLKENKTRTRYEYAPGDKVYLYYVTRRQKKLDIPQGPFTIVAIRPNGTVVLDKGLYTEIVNIRNISPAPSDMGENAMERPLPALKWSTGLKKSYANPNKNVTSYFEPGK